MNSLLTAVQFCSRSFSGNHRNFRVCIKFSNTYVGRYLLTKLLKYAGISQESKFRKFNVRITFFFSYKSIILHHEKAEKHGLRLSIVLQRSLFLLVFTRYYWPSSFVMSSSNRSFDHVERSWRSHDVAKSSQCSELYNLYIELYINVTQ